jgi:hypothetical protein
MGLLTSSRWEVSGIIFLFLFSGLTLIV